MMGPVRLPWDRRQVSTALIPAAVLAAAFALGSRASSMWLALLGAAAGGVLLLRQPTLGLLALVVAALVAPFEVGTGTEVSLNAATLLIPAVTAVWLLSMVTRGRVHFAQSRVNHPLLLFLIAGLLSLLIGIATWDPTVPRKESFMLVQLAQWAIFAFSALAFWLGANLIRDEHWLYRLLWCFLFLGGVAALLRLTPGVKSSAVAVTTIAFIRAPFWILLSGLAAGQLLFNRNLTWPRRVFLALVLIGTGVYGFVDQQEAASNWVGLVAVWGALLWLRFPHLRWLALVGVVALIALGLLFPAVYQFAGGDAEWDESGASRLVLMERVIEVTMRNPVTGLGPAAYRPYANMRPLPYGRAYWLDPQINSHNNYVDIFAHGGILGLLLFFWFVGEVGWLGRKLNRRYAHDFKAGYANGMIGVGVGALAIMAFADWILPFVYNIGFAGFQASVLVWLFLGGLVALERMPSTAEKVAT